MANAWRTRLSENSGSVVLKSQYWMPMRPEEWNSSVPMYWFSAS